MIRKNPVILIVEDDADIANLIAHYLQRAGHRTDVIVSGDDAIPAVQERQPDLLILDLMLPGRQGLEICRTIRRDPTLSRLPIMFVREWFLD